jgi:hypothetical protein
MSLFYYAGGIPGRGIPNELLEICTYYLLFFLKKKKVVELSAIAKSPASNVNELRALFENRSISKHG